MTIEANIVDIEGRQIFFGHLKFEGKEIIEIKVLGEEKSGFPYALPGFVDAHVHIESSMLTPANFARLAVVHGTVGTVSDPHEIANVLGVEGVNFMIEDGKKVPFHFAFGAPSCVPATTFETAGAVIDATEIEKLLNREEVKYLAEMMNYPGVIYEDREVMAKLNVAKKVGKPVDGHAPGLMGESARKYFSHGISTDHECYMTEEAEQKLRLGVKILIREGSAAKNFEALIGLSHEHWQNMMFCSDDKHPDDLVLGHINLLVKRAVNDKKLDLFKTLQMACVNPVVHYKLDCGLMKVGHSADFILVNDLIHFEVTSAYISGQLVAENGKTLLPASKTKIVNYFQASPISKKDLVVKAQSELRIIVAHDGQLITSSKYIVPKEEDGLCIQDLDNDFLKIVVYNRYTAADPAIAFIHGFGLKHGAIASSVAHDSHNVICVGCDDLSIAKAINAVVYNKGGVVAVLDEQVKVLPLPIAGLISDMDGYVVAKTYEMIDGFVKDQLGTGLTSPFMTLSFMALLVIPELKLSDLGLFDGEKFSFVK